jgi:glutamate-ammonia-ligase adenylyltransferase
MGGEPGSGAELAESYRRVARRARTVVELDFYDTP